VRRLIGGGDGDSDRIFSAQESFAHVPDHICERRRGEVGGRLL
jgi:hypothetical protein